MEEQLKQTEQFRKSDVPSRNILRFFREQNVGCTVRFVFPTINKMNFMMYVVHRKYTMLLPRLRRTGCRGKHGRRGSLLKCTRGYIIFYRNTKDSNVLSDIVVVHPTSIAMIRTWTYVLIMDTTYKMNNAEFWVETTNRAENEHSVLKLWLSTCHGDLDTVFLNIDSVIESQIAKIKSSLEISKLKEKFGAKSNPMLKNLSNAISHLALKKIVLEVKRAREIVDDLQDKCGHYLRKLHGLPCACEIVAQ
ncbi:hypothetical protein M9H77_23464 [Catharanthus roseus]|uniref:Uncharacterized protein n=1 Tax=Catharanthus roseus TaxID=4058 RepID=A0ACC0AXG3_CATRO|nr:hypothetical protein M9H77_23464 [Catharanthus roseus]